MHVRRTEFRRDLRRTLLLAAVFLAIFFTQAVERSSGQHFRRVRIDNHGMQRFAAVQAPTVALTFDDGPSPDTLPILDTLQRYHAKATFFVLGENVQRYPEIARAIVQAGDQIGNHGFTHRTPKSAADARAEIIDTDELIYLATQQHTQIFRPPGGDSSSRLAAAAKSTGLHLIGWSLDAQDWKAPNAQRIATTVLREAKPGDIILLHDGPSRPATVKALTAILQGLKERGLIPVTISELLEQERSTHQSG